MNSQNQTAPNPQPSADSTNKKPYETPALIKHGSVEQLTEAKAGGSGIAF